MELLGLGCDIRYGAPYDRPALRWGPAHRLVRVQEIDGAEPMICPQIRWCWRSATLTRAITSCSSPGRPDYGAQKPFAIGVRIEHDQDAVSQAQFGPAWDRLPPSDYKLSCHLPSGRSAFTFCVCPGGQVVAAASEQGALVTNGMSYRARDGRNINGGFLVGVNPEDFGGDDPLAGVRFQTHWEQLAFRHGGGGIPRPGAAGGGLSCRQSIHCLRGYFAHLPAPA